MQAFDFDYWCDLARRDPEAFFRERSQLIDAYINAQPTVQAVRLRAYQRQIDCLRANAATPDSALRCLLTLIGRNLQALERLSCALNQVCQRTQP